MNLAYSYWECSITSYSTKDSIIKVVYSNYSKWFNKKLFCSV